MSVHAKSWLPLRALDREGVRAPVAAAVSEWSAAWFGRRFQATNFWPTEHKPWSTADESGWLRYGEAVSLSFAGGARERLVGEALDCPFASLALTPADEEVVARFADDLFGDLTTRVEGAFGLKPPDKSSARRVEAPFGPLGGVEIAVRDAEGRSALRIAAPFETVLPLCLRTLPPPRRAAPIRTRRRQAIGEVRVALRATLGHADVGLADLRRLAQGDVLVLDRALDDGALLTSTEDDTPLAVGRLGADGDRVALTVQLGD